MDTSPRRQVAHTSQALRSHNKAGQSQTTIDSYLRPVVKVEQGQNDIRNYFAPVAKAKVTPHGILSKSNSPKKIPIKIPTAPKASHNSSNAVESQNSGPRTSAEVLAEITTPVPDSQRSGIRAAGNLIRARNHNHANSAVLPNFDPFFDEKGFPHSTSPMAPRVTDVVRHSLVPKPLNIRMPPFPAETSRSPSETTSSPWSVEEADTASLDEEGREAPSFKQTYLSVHSRRRANDSPVSPLTALRDPSSKPMRRLPHRPVTLRSKTMPQLSEFENPDNVIYFLPKTSPVSDSSADEREPLRTTRYLKPIDKASRPDLPKAKRQAVKLEDVGATQVEKKRDGLTQEAMTISPGM